MSEHRSARRSATIIVGVLALGLITAAAGCTSTPVPSSTASGSGPRSTTPAAPSAVRAATTAPVVAADKQQRSSVPAVTALATLPTKGRAAKTGYARIRFGTAWTDDTDNPLGHNGCDTRNDILRRDLVDETIKAKTAGCVVLSGELRDPYTGGAILFRRGGSTSSAVQIDHVVPLGDAWQTGAQRLSEQQRTRLANDPLELLAVDGPTNVLE